MCILINPRHKYIVLCTIYERGWRTIQSAWKTLNQNVRRVTYGVRPVLRLVQMVAIETVGQTIKQNKKVKQNIHKINYKTKLSVYMMKII